MTDDETRQPADAGPVEQRVRPLVERLRARRNATRWQRGLDLDYATAWEPDALCAEAADEIERLRAALDLAAPALEIGCDALRAEAERYHAEMAGYRPDRHQELDDDYKRADLAWQAVVAALGPNVNSGTDHVA